MLGTICSAESTFSNSSESHCNTPFFPAFNNTEGSSYSFLSPSHTQDLHGRGKPRREGWSMEFARPSSTSLQKEKLTLCEMSGPRPLCIQTFLYKSYNNYGCTPDFYREELELRRAVRIKLGLNPSFSQQAFVNWPGN